MNQKSSIGRIVHYVHNNTGVEPYVAIITLVTPFGDVWLTVFPPGRPPYTLTVAAPYSETRTPGTWHWPEREEPDAGHFPREMMQTGGAGDCNAKFMERCRFLELDLANAKEALKSICDDVIVALAGSGVGTPEEGYFKESGRPWVKHDILELRQERDDYRRASAGWCKESEVLKAQLTALLNDEPLPNGDYVHSVTCNANRKQPVGNDMCSCGIGKRLKLLQGHRDERENLLKWLDEQIAEDDGAIQNARGNLEWERERYLCGHKDALIAVKQHLQGPQ